MLDSGEAAKNREIQPEATFDLISNPGSERVNSNPRMQIADIYKLFKVSVSSLRSE
jgi:hypothetical protein